MEYKNVTETIIGVATGKPIGLILDFGESKVEIKRLSADRQERSRI